MAKQNDPDWLYATYPKPNGQMRKSSTGFLMHDGLRYPVKPLGRFANELAGTPMASNPITDIFRRHFERLGFQLIVTPLQEAEDAVERQRHLAKIWARPRQAQFRCAVFQLYGARCVVSGCDTLEVLEAAHILPVAGRGGDEAWNGIPLRADLHRLFDCGLMTLNPDNWKLSIGLKAGDAYRLFDELDLTSIMTNKQHSQRVAVVLKARMKSELSLTPTVR